MKKEMWFSDYSYLYEVNKRKNVMFGKYNPFLKFYMWRANKKIRNTIKSYLEDAEKNDFVVWGKKEENMLSSREKTWREAFKQSETLEDFLAGLNYRHLAKIQNLITGRYLSVQQKLEAKNE